MFTIMRRCVMRKNRLARSKVKVILQGQMSKIDQNQLVRTITLSLVEGISNNLAQMLTIMSRCVMRKNRLARSKVKVTLEGQMRKIDQK